MVDGFDLSSERQPRAVVKSTTNTHLECKIKRLHGSIMQPAGSDASSLSHVHCLGTTLRCVGSRCVHCVAESDMTCEEDEEEDRLNSIGTAHHYTYSAVSYGVCTMTGLHVPMHAYYCTNSTCTSVPPGWWVGGAGNRGKEDAGRLA